MTTSTIVPATERTPIRIGTWNGFIIIEMDKAVNHIQMTVDEAAAFIKALHERVIATKIVNGGGVALDG